MADFRIGDTVRLATGGPLMRVQAQHDDMVTCLYFNSAEAHGSSEPLVFPKDTLQAAAPDENPDKPTDEARENSKFGYA